jgi:hypothetical protein
VRAQSAAADSLHKIRALKSVLNRLLTHADGAGRMRLAAGIGQIQDSPQPYLVHFSSEAANKMSESNVLANQKQILKNQKAILANQGQIKANQETIKKNQVAILKNQKQILAAVKK